jgi:sterol desaturase/sphingolipid hydroxylase (fatty acid hydroxylase superfamily)
MTAAGWSAGFRKLAPGRFAIWGPIALAVHDASRPQPGQPRMFDQAFLEWFTGSHPATLAAIYLPVVALLVWSGVAMHLAPAAVLSLFAGGVLFWSLLEYLIHRFAFHFAPRGRWGVMLAYLIHGVHHAFPEDRRRWVMPPVVSLPVVIVLAAAFGVALGRLSGPLLAGAVAAYLWYDLAHYAFHRGPLRWRVLNALRRNHLQHHYACPERQFGVSSTFWDHVFRTR